MTLFFQYSKLQSAIENYIHLERIITKSISAICKPFCKRCHDICCREEICRESFDSVWLRMVLTLNGHSILHYNDSTGWLGTDGCTIQVGRPPVCHEYFCTKIISELKIAPVKLIVEGLSGLIPLVGANIIGNDHLVTATITDELRQANLDKLLERLEAYLKVADKYHVSLQNTIYQKTRV